MGKNLHKCKSQLERRAKRNRRYMYSLGKSALQKNKASAHQLPSFLHLQNLEVLLKLDMTSRAKSRSSALQTGFYSAKI
jgi:hypothetical protein